MRSVHHSSAFDGVREAAMRTGSSGSGMGHGRTLLTRRREPLDLGWVAFAVIGLVILGALSWRLL